MPKVRLLNGKPLMVNGKVALSDDCCCGAGPCQDIVCAATLDVTISGLGLCSGGSGSVTFTGVPLVADHVVADGNNICAWSQISGGNEIFVGHINNTCIWEVDVYQGLVPPPPDCPPYIGSGQLIGFNGISSDILSPIANNLTA